MNRLCLKYIVLLFILVTMVTSCKTKDKLKSGDNVENFKSISDAFLIDNILKNQIDFNSLYIKKMSVDLDDNGKNISARAMMYIEKDKRIVIQVTFLIEVARILIEPNGITIINRIEKDVYYTNFEYINRKFHIDLNFNLLQAIFTNMLFSYPDGGLDAIKKYQIEGNEGRYILKSFNQAKYERMVQQNPELFLHQINVNQDGYKIVKNEMSNMEGAKVEVSYSAFDNLNTIKFPYTISLRGKKGSDSYGLTLKYSNIDIDGSEKITFSVPDNYGKGVLNF